MSSLKKKIQAVVYEKQLSSILNNTKWEKLQNGVLTTLPFPPPFQAKYVLEEKPVPETFDEDVWYLGDWIEGLLPFYSVEWIRVRPRCVKHRGRLIKPDLIDITEDFRTLLTNIQIPYIEKDNSFFIYGYASTTDSGAIQKNSSNET